MSEFTPSEVPVEILQPEMREECGAFAMFTEPGSTQVAAQTYQGLQANQNRGQEAAGMSISNGRDIMVTHGFGKVDAAFRGGADLRGLHEGHISSGQVRYSTSGTPKRLQAQATQPIFYAPKSPGLHPFTLAENGHDESAKDIAAEHGVDLTDVASDTDAKVRLIGQRYEEVGDLEKALSDTLPLLQGAASMIVTTPESIMYWRDQHGYRPLHVGRLASGRGWVLSSERAGLSIVGASHYGEHNGGEAVPGELVVLSGHTEQDIKRIQLQEPDPKVCAFEFVYLSRPDNVLYGENVFQTRIRAGEFLADEVQKKGIIVDSVLDVPESGKGGALGFSRKSGVPYEPSLVRNNYVDRSFIAPDQDARIQKVRNKLNPLREMIVGRRLMVIDDSIVRGTTSKIIVEMLRQAGASEVHLGITSDKYVNTCHWGVDTGDPDELLARNMSDAEMLDFLNADSITFLPVEKMKRSFGKAARKVCTECMILPPGMEQPA